MENGEWKELNLEELQSRLDRKLPWYKSIYYRIYRMPQTVRYILARKYKLEKEHREIGLTYWDRPQKRFWFDAYGKIAWDIYPILVRFRRGEFCGVPMEFNNLYGNEHDMEKWLEAIDKMIYSFREILMDSYDLPFDLDKHKARQDKIDEGLQLFAKYFQNLWD
jgi:hypothetical protein